MNEIENEFSGEGKCEKEKYATDKKWVKREN